MSESKGWAAFVLVFSSNVQRQLDEMPEAVRALVREHAGNPVGKCDRCGNRAPLAHSGYPHGTRAENICSWGCETKEET